ncbi:MAG: tRNA 2-thiouridine(34) synthase MnmA [Erysipelotrichaceae bacterium]|nr:tRNA 2-thiouridine(34) synthase MnmA [Erysipelotrichaceae bacterium]
MSKKVILGLSGGVDSAVAAYILKEQGYDVECAFMRNWDAMANNDFLGNPTNNDSQCPQEKDWEDACSVAEALGLKIHRIDFVKEYWDNVFQVFIDEYQKGRTPNPDILCNKYIKFDYFLKFALELGADYVATGHYARVDHTKEEEIMLRGLDNNKDQTYFLCQLNQYQLSKTLFPIGELQKSEVRKIANELQLRIANKKDSTGICFIGERNFREFLKNYIPMKEGNIIEYETGKVVGKHQGVMYYTIGQRKGLGIGGPGGPWFVIGKSVTKNELYVAQGAEDQWLFTNSCLVKGVNWISPKRFEGKLDCTAKFRYRQADKEVTLSWINDTDLLVEYKNPVSSVTPGQEAVFYQGEVCLGGGVIEEVYKNGEKVTYIE